MDYKYKKIRKDWTSRDSRFHYRKGDEVMVLKEDDKYHTVALDVAIVGCIPNEYFDDGNELKDAGVLGLVMSKYTKDLLLKDLCGRLPYGVKAQVLGWDEEKGEVEVPLKIYSINTDGYVYFETNDYDVNYLPVEDVRPYLRPLSSMTEEEKRTLQSFYPMSFGNQYLDLDKEKIELYECNSTMEFYLDDSVQMVDFCKKNHLDCYGLIKEGLALSTDEYNPYV